MDKKNTSINPFFGYAILFIILSFILFFLALITEHTIGSKLEYQKNLTLYLSSIEKQRRHSDDLEFRSKLIREGFVASIYPDLIHSVGQIKELGLENLPLPLANKPFTKIYYCNEGEGTVHYTSDRFGFRNPDSHWDDIQLNQYHFLIGDSFVHGACVANDQHISQVMNKSGHIFLNLGTGSNNPVHYASTINVFSGSWKPSSVGIFFYPNDNDEKSRDEVINFNPWYSLYLANNLSSEYFSPTNDRLSQSTIEAIDKLNKYAATKINLEETPIEIKTLPMPSAWDYFSKEKIFNRQFFLFSNLKLSIDQLILQPKSLLAPLPFTSTLAINTLANNCNGSNCHPYIVYIPNSKYWRPDSRAKYYKAALKEYAHKKNIQFIDGEKAIDTSSLSDYATKGPHLSALGYEKLSNLINQIMLKKLSD